VGLVLLAHAPLETQERVLAGSLPRLTRQTVTDPRELRRLLADVRRCGIAVSSRQTAEDTLAVAAPVFGPRDEVVAAVSVVTRAGGPDHLALVPAVRAAARGLSRALGSPTAARSPIGARRRPA
jgi:DNA-binding IclR family transcriptional regulator